MRPRSPNSWASNLSIVYCFCLVWVKVPTASSQLMTREGRHRELKIQRTQSLAPEKGKNISVQGQIFLQLVPPRSIPALQSSEWSLGKVSTHISLPKIWPSSPPVHPCRGETVKQSNFVYPLPPRANSKVSQKLGTAPPTMTQRPKITEEAPPPKERGGTSIQRTVLSQTKRGFRWAMNLTSGLSTPLSSRASNACQF